MSRELWLLRHAKADRNLALDDFDRPLKKRGKRAAEKLGAWLCKQQLIPDRIISSPAKRALATAKIVHKAFAIESPVYLEPRLYQAGLASLKAVIAECPTDVGRLLLVGHNPELEDLLIDLVGPGRLPVTDKLIATATLVRLKLADDWADLVPGSARLLAITAVKSLPETDI